MKNKKGFTLIELLAVIVILGVLLAIAVPAVTKYINSSKKSTFISNVKQYADSARTDALSSVYPFPVSTDHATVISFETIYPSLEKGGKTSSYGGEWNYDKSFVMIVNAGAPEQPKYEYYIAAIDTKGYGLGSLDASSNTTTAAYIEYNELKDEDVVQLGTDDGDGISVPDLSKDNTVTLADGRKIIVDTVVVKYAAYQVGDAVTLSDGSKWHVLEDSDESKASIVLLSDYNLNSDGSYNTGCTGTCSTMAFDSDNTNVYDENDSNNIGYFIKSVYKPLVTSSLPGTTNVTLPTAEQIAIADGHTFSESGAISSNWLATTNYWTKTSFASFSTHAYYIDSNIKYIVTLNTSSNTHNGARPIITTLKTNIR